MPSTLAFWSGLPEVGVERDIELAIRIGIGRELFDDRRVHAAGRPQDIEVGQDLLTVDGDIEKRGSPT